MSLTATEVRVLSRLLERALALPAAAREAWLVALPEPQQMLVPRIRERLTQLAQTEAETPPPPPPPKSAPPPELRVGPYRLLQPLGADERAPVWRAERADGAARKVVALRLPPAPGTEVAPSLAAERQVVLLPEHPDIVRLIDAGIDAEGRFYRVLPYVEGLGLVEHVQRRGLGAHQRATLMLKACALLAHAHDEEVAYGELQLSSLRVDDEGRLRLLDWGQGRCLLPLTRVADVQGLGRVMQAVLTGQEVGHVVSAHRVPDPGPDLRHVLLRALHAPSVQGYASVREMQDDLQWVCDFRPVPGADGGPLHLARLFLRRHRARLVVGLLAAVLLAAAVNWAWRNVQRSQGQAQRADQVQFFLEESLQETSAPAAAASAAADPAVQAPRLQRALEKARMGLDGEPVLRGQVITALGVRFRALGQPEQALAVLREAHTLLQGTASAGDPALHTARSELAVQLLDSGAAGASAQAAALARQVLDGCTTSGDACAMARQRAQVVLKTAGGAR